ncbi:hypothetical protein M404DRAFT_1000908 [Pisolithus tinctorius Marx 270]|uniref:Uncharacterized protein n=1 Tax=Pisolithus tinctorius Marx 270 TaxID=870435 RepID=A0A0C3NT57_PISTI|nr:hypothetical protein M404DRAFT_1000908 [Pisolithus tinctorius Marx 270]
MFLPNHDLFRTVSMMMTNCRVFQSQAAWSGDAAGRLESFGVVLGVLVLHKPD